MSTNKIAILKDRASMFFAVRDFFAKRAVLEVDVPILAPTGSIDPFIDLISATCARKKAYLHSSPEYGMKRLLSVGIGDIYQLSHVFRDAEIGQRHNPEFTMIEWYRLNFSFEQLIEETLDLMRLFFHEPRQEVLSYKEIFLKYGGKGIEVSDQEFALEIEPKLGREGFTVIRDLPADQAQLAKIVGSGEDAVARRFEVYYQGMELANGYDELKDPIEQKRRLERASQKRIENGKELPPMDDDFLQALERGLPECVGVAVGFDRLMMLRHHASHIEEVIAFAWKM